MRGPDQTPCNSLHRPVRTEQSLAPIRFNPPATDRPNTDGKQKAPLGSTTRSIHHVHARIVIRRGRERRDTRRGGGLITHAHTTTTETSPCLDPAAAASTASAASANATSSGPAARPARAAESSARDTPRRCGGRAALLSGDASPACRFQTWLHMLIRRLQRLQCHQSRSHSRYPVHIHSPAHIHSLTTSPSGSTPPRTPPPLPRPRPPGTPSPVRPTYHRPPVRALAWNGSCLQSVGPPCPAKCRYRTPAKPVLVLSSGLRRLYTTEASCWIQPHFEEMALQSPALVRISAAIQAYLDDGNETPSVQSMEHVDLALQTFRLELASRHEAMHAATLCAGLLLCTLRVRFYFISFACSSSHHIFHAYAVISAVACLALNL